jgi:hypothetical protein
MPLGGLKEKESGKRLFVDWLDRKNLAIQWPIGQDL